MKKNILVYLLILTMIVSISATYIVAKNMLTPDFSVKFAGTDQSKLQFKDNDKNLATIPLLYSNGGSLKLGDNNDDLITREGVTITKNDYLIVTAEGQGSYALRYKGADKVAPGEIALVKFDDLGTGHRIEVSYDRLTGATLHLGGYSFKVISVSYDGIDDFDVKVDLNADGIISDNYVDLVTYNRKVLAIDYPQNDCGSHELSIGGVSNQDGKIAVEYKTVGTGGNVQVQLIVVSTIPEPEEPIPEVPEEPVPSPGGSGGGAGAISCPITGITECTEAYGSDVAYCTVQTECNYPEFQPNTRYYVKIIDNECPAVSHSTEIIGTPAPTCTDTDGGNYVYIAGKVYGMDGSWNNYVYPDLCEEDPLGSGKIVLKEMYCSDDNEPKSMPPYECPYGCQDGACLLGCNSHDVTINDILNHDGNIAVSYQIVDQDNVKIEMITPDYSSNITGTVEVTPCLITSGVCGSGSGSNIISCTVDTQCKYPLLNFGQSIRVTDLNCLDVYDERDIFLK